MPDNLSDSPTLWLARELVGRASVTPEDAGCQRFIAERLAAVDFDCTWLSKNGVTNLWARRGSGHPLLCFAGHTDVVPSGDGQSWTVDPFTPTIIGDNIYGRGIADMKGGVAAFVVALENFVRRSPRHRGSLAVLLTSDEEGDAVNGTAHVVEALKAQNTNIDYCIIGEPSSRKRVGDTLKNGRRGSMNGILLVHGIQGHIAYPQDTKNPIHMVIPALAELLATDWDDGKKNQYFPPTSLQCSNIHAGMGASNVVPEALTLHFNFRFSSENTAESLQARVETILRKHRLNYTLTWQFSGKPFLTPHGDLVEHAVDAVKDIMGITPRLSCDGGTSDGRFIADICPQLIEMGLPNATIHKIDEHVPVADLDMLTLIYERLIERLLNDGQ
ncbi:MAG: succinyl-diaminopimelate desuccinylase [Burkholderiales bacterium]|jgi:succinyl-diaminopimelate desuccinylase|nr:succinyl-diaminopimelate desuccinylase [Burkholderiales bacterium]